MKITHDVIGWIAAVITVFIGLPQLIKLLKTKNSAGINLISNWLFFAGLILWKTYGSYAFEYGGKIYQSAASNVLSTGVYGVMLFYIYKYREGMKKQNVITVGIIIATLVALNTASFAFGMIRRDVGFDDATAKLVCSIVTGFLTTFAFTPQTIQSMITKNVKNVSVMMMVVFVALNSLWIVFWLTPYTQSILPFLIYQIISLTLAATMLIICLIYKDKKQQPEEKVEEKKAEI
ncbi:PQ-loop domain-containing transporter [Mycoplasmopsis equigenitalium]|uniref:PQ-loop domain-containing transporter n=1 Tax=Mycoplasmopsis equigenitalium TaxID=114883 RepID=A0ABY5J123_9BACT|nr:PQ-loop domain-containing transporter [Mycoplasmopsis equigenitalium]UUD36957.1 PQ-loop domain-containing transporter [Mycoplasmopsis equigenitalium]